MILFSEKRKEARLLAGGGGTLLTSADNGKDSKEKCILQ